MTLNIDHAYANRCADGSKCDGDGFFRSNPCDSYIVVHVNGYSVHRTAIKSDTANPNFNERYKTELIPKTSTIKFEMWDDDSGSSDDDLILTWAARVSDLLVRSSYEENSNKLVVFSTWEDEDKNIEGFQFKTHKYDFSNFTDIVL